MHPDIFKGLLCLADINLSEFLLCQNDLASNWSKLSLSLACYRYIEWVMFLYFAATVKPTTWDRKVLPLKIVKSIWSWQTQKFKIGFDIILFSATKSGWYMVILKKNTYLSRELDFCHADYIFNLKVWLTEKPQTNININD